MFRRCLFIVLLFAVLTACGATGSVEDEDQATEGTSSGTEAASSSAAATASTGEPMTVVGSLRLLDHGRQEPGAPCAASSGYDDIRTGAQVSVYDADSTAVGLGELSAGHTDRELIDGSILARSASDCVFNFVVEVPQAEGDIFSIEVSHRGRVQFTRDEATNVQLTLGD